MLTQGQKAYLLAGLAGCDLRTVQRHLRGEPVRGTLLRERLAAAEKRVDVIARDTDDRADSRGTDRPSSNLAA